MKSFFLIFSVLTGLQLSAETIHIEKLSKNEKRWIRWSLEAGKSPEQALKTPGIHRDNTCEAPTFMDINKQGYVEVPEDYAKPLGRKIQVFYYGRVQTGKDPVVFFNGGPGADSHGSAEILESYYKQAPEVDKLSFVYIDQRGTGCSSQFPDETTEETIERLKHYTSDSIVKDAEAVREKLFGANSKWKVFGQSYGGLIVHRYALEAPNSIMQAYAHGFSLMKDQNNWLELRVRSQKRVIEIYLAKYPNDHQAIAKTRVLIKEDLCFNDGDTQICGPKVLDALTIFLGFSNNWDYMHQIIGKLRNSDGSLNMISLSDFVTNYVFGVYNNSGLAGSVISMSEISSGESDKIACARANQAILAGGEDPEKWLINECRLLAGFENDEWAELLKGVTIQKQMLPAHLKTQLKKYPKLSFFLYSGEKDVFVPMETFKEEVTELGNLITYRQFPNTGHEGFYTERQVWKDLVIK